MKNRILTVAGTVIFVIAVVTILFYEKKAPIKAPEVQEQKKETVVIQKVRNALSAGAFYPPKGPDLKNFVEHLLKGANKIPVSGKVKAIIVPHAGYIYSGYTAAAAFKQLESSYKRIFIIGSNHNSKAIFNGFSIPDATHYATPLGLVTVSGLAKELLKKHPDVFTTNHEAHATHVVEVELPFLQTALEGEFEIIPMISGKISYKDVDKVARIIEKYLDDDTLLVVSSDFSHYMPYERAKEFDKHCINAIKDLSVEGVAACQACGRGAIHVLINIALAGNYNVKVLDVRNSGDSVGDKSKVVGYASMLFYDNGPLSFKDKVALVDLSRNVLESHITQKKEGITSVEELSKLPDIIKQKVGCFVTLKKNGSLRGCIGNIIPKESLYECIINNTINAAVYDSRFRPVEVSELKDIDIELSLLTVPTELDFEDSAELFNILKPILHGVILKQGEKSSTFLPHVWHSFSSKAEFLNALCQKGGMNKNCWKEKNTEVFVYKALVF